MTRVLFIITLVLCMWGSVGYAQKKSIDPKNLPEKAKTFLSTYYAKIDVASAKEEVASWFEKKEYEVKLKDGEKIEFDDQGNWKEVDGKRSAIPLSLIPENIIQYVKRSFPKTDVIKLKRDKKKYEVAISNGLELEFDKKGKFIKIED